MKMKRTVLLFLIFTLCSCSSGGREDEYSFRHQQGVADYDSTVIYNDNLFDGPSTVFNYSLASASICFAMASFASMEKPLDYSDKYKNAKDLLHKFGFVDFDVNDDYKTKPTTDSIGLLSAHKKVGEYTLVAVGVRGAAYESEWASNFTLAHREDGYHDGFRTAADNYITWLKSYLEKYNISGNIKIWATGYSRAGATTNIASGLIDQSIDNNTHILGEQINLTKENFYSYCFEDPMGAPNYKDENGNIIVKGEAYKNIFNIINFNDPVPLTAMKEVGFTRFGIDLFLPEPIKTLHYQNHFEVMNGIYERMSNNQAIGNYKIFDFAFKGTSAFSIKDYAKGHAMSQGIFLRELISSVSIDGLNCDLDYYVNSIQTGLRNVFAMLYKSGLFKGSLLDIGLSMINDLNVLNEIDILLSDLLVERSVKAFSNDFSALLTRGLNHLGMTEIDTTVTASELTELTKTFGRAFLANVTDNKSYILLSFFNVDNIKSIGSGHYPELCEAHIKALDEHYNSNPYRGKMDGKYYVLKINDINAQISVKNVENEIVRINLGDEIDNRISYIQRADGYEIYLPGDATYQVDLDNNYDVSLSYFDRNKDDLVDVDVLLDSDYSFNIL